MQYACCRQPVSRCPQAHGFIQENLLFPHLCLDASAAFGWTQGEPPRFDWAHFLLRKDVEIARLESIYERNLQSAGVETLADRCQASIVLLESVLAQPAATVGRFMGPE